MEYFIPGFIFVWIFQFLTSRKNSDYQVVISIAISYILKAICSICHGFIFTNISFSWSWRVIILSLLAGILSVVFIVLTENRYINKIFSYINNKSIHDDIWHDVIDYRNGTTLQFICGDAIYIGVLVGHEEKGNDSWFILDDFVVETKDKSYKAKDMPYRARMAINLKNVDRVELYYGDPPQTWANKIKDFFANKIFKKKSSKEQENP